MKPKADRIIVRKERNRGYSLLTNEMADFTRLIWLERGHAGLARMPRTG